MVAPAVDNLILTLLIRSDAPPLRAASQIRDGLEGSYGITVSPALVQASLDRMLNQGRLLRNDGSSFSLSMAAKASIERDLEAAVSLESDVRQQWLTALPEPLRPTSDRHADQLWQAVSVYLGKTYLRHGAETALLINPALNEGDRVAHSLSSYLAEAIAECCPGQDRELIQAAIKEFFKDPPPKRTRYLAELLDGGFTLFALTADRATAEYLSGQLRSITLFLDTNFIFALLGMGPERFVATARALRDLLAENNLPFRICYHESTLDELRRTVFALGDRIRSRRWQQAVSRAAVRTGELSGLERMYHRLNAQQAIEPDVFLAKYEHMEDLLRDLGLQKHTERPSDDAEVWDKGSQVAEYGEFLADHRPRGTKPYEALDHDMTVLRAIQRVRGDATSILNAKALFLTNDYFLYLYDLRKLRKRGKIGTVVLPNQLIQLLRPFTAASPDSDRKFVEAFMLPQLRTGNMEYQEATSATLQIINQYGDVSESTAMRILADEYLGNRLRKLDPKSPAFAAEVNRSLAQDLQALTRKHEELASQVTEITTQLNARDADAATSDERARMAEEATESASRSARDVRVAMERVSAERDADKRGHAVEIENARRRFRYLVGGGVAVISILLILLGPQAFGWTWFLHHKARLGLDIEAIILAIGCGWAIGNRNERTMILVGVAVVAAVTIGTLVVIQ